MDRTLSVIDGGGARGQYGRALAEAETAIAMGACGAAVSVRLVNLAAGEEAAIDAAARAQAAGVAFSLSRDGSGLSTMIVGPRLGPAA